MTKIDELMALAEEYAQECKDFGHISDSLPKQALKQALEAALKPGEPHHWIVPEFGFLFPTEDAARRYLENIGSPEKPTACYTAAPPAQTPASTVTVSYDLSPAETESAIHQKLIEMGWTPPAQTPPRLTDTEMLRIWIDSTGSVDAFGISVETAVRKRFGVNDE